MRLDGATALVTGGGSGLGAATVRRLAADGMRVVLVDLPSSAGAEVAEELGERVRFVPADVRDAEQIGVAVDAAVADGPFRVVVNCAGVADAARSVGRGGKPLPLAEFQRIVEVNLIGTFNVVRLSVAAMVTHTPLDGEERGVCVNTASIAAFDGQTGTAAYSASKGGVASMTLPLAREFSEQCVRVMSIAPGLFRTPMLERLPAGAITALERQIPHPKRLGDPSEFAALVAHIVENPSLNGEVIRLDGAVRMSHR